MKSLIVTTTVMLSFTGALLAQEQDPIFYSPSEAFRKLYRKMSRGPHKTGVDVRSYDPTEDCSHDECPEMECIQRDPVKDCVPGKKKVFLGSILCEYVVVAEVRYRWKTKWITKEVPADCQDPVCKTEDGECLHLVEDWKSNPSCEGKLYCQTNKPDNDGVEVKRIECEPGKTTVKVKYRSLVKEPYTVYRQIQRPIGVKQPDYECVDVPVTRYVGTRLKTDCK